MASYATESEADTYHTAHGAPTTWSGSTSAQKVTALAEGTQYLDLKYGLRWKGEKADQSTVTATGQPTQVEDWPRAFVRDRDGAAIDSDFVPVNIVDACAVMALKYRELATGTLLTPDLDNPGAVKSLRQKIGPLEEATEYAGARLQEKRFVLVDRLVQELIVPGSRVWVS